MTTLATTPSLQRELAAIAGERYVTQEHIEINGVTPAATVAPGSTEEVAAVLRVAYERELVVVPTGGSTKLQ